MYPGGPAHYALGGTPVAAPTTAYEGTGAGNFASPKTSRISRFVCLPCGNRCSRRIGRRLPALLSAGFPIDECNSTGILTICSLRR